MKYRFFIAGHVYGEPGGINKGLYLKFIDQRLGANIMYKDLKVDLELVHSLKKELEHYKKL